MLGDAAYTNPMQLTPRKCFCETLATTNHGVTLITVRIHSVKLGGQSLLHSLRRGQQTLQHSKPPNVFLAEKKWHEPISA